LRKTALEKAREAPGSTKARILAAAEEVFASRGFQGASTREIAARAGVNISSLHYHWESKETLYFAVFRNIFDRIVDLLKNTLAPHIARAGSPRHIIDRTMGGVRLLRRQPERAEAAHASDRRERGHRRRDRPRRWCRPGLRGVGARLRRRPFSTTSRDFMLSMHSSCWCTPDSQSHAACSTAACADPVRACART
jgi:AcrR family transcriptional regulator